MAAQEKVYQIDEVSVINYGDGRLLFRQLNDDKTPLQGEHRIIDGYHSEYLLATLKTGCSTDCIVTSSGTRLPKRVFIRMVIWTVIVSCITVMVRLYNRGNIYGR